MYTRKSANFSWEIHGSSLLRRNEYKMTNLRRRKYLNNLCHLLTPSAYHFLCKLDKFLIEFRLLIESEDERIRLHRHEISMQWVFYS